MLNKRGIGVNVIIAVGLLIISFIILIIVYYQFSWTGSVDEQTCHQSVVYRATLPSFKDNADYVPLKCKTQKVCITSSGLFGGKCVDFNGLSGVTKVNVNDNTQIEKTIAEGVVDCWKEMGEGKVSLFSQFWAQKFGVGSVYPTCVICKRIAFDSNSLAKSKIDLSKMNVEDYMRTRAIPGGDISYVDYLGGGKISFDKDMSITLPSLVEPNQTRNSEGSGTTSEPYLTDGGTDRQIEVNPITNADINAQAGDTALQNHELAILFMQISAPSHGEAAWNAAKAIGGIAASSFMTAPKTSTQGAKLAVKLCTSGGWVGPAICAGVLVLAAAYQQGNIAYNRAVTAGYCGDISTGSEARDGCSVVRTVNYNMDEISQYCSVIESIP